MTLRQPFFVFDHVICKKEPRRLGVGAKVYVTEGLCH